MARALMIIGIVLSILLGAALFLFLLIGTAMGGDSLGAGYAPWATAALIAYPIVIVAILVVALVLGIRATSRGTVITSVALAFAAVPIGFLVWMGLVAAAMAAGAR
jgi:hypothetical protein